MDLFLGKYMKKGQTILEQKNLSWYRLHERLCPVYKKRDGTFMAVDLKSLIHIYGLNPIPGPFLIPGRYVGWTIRRNFFIREIKLLMRAINYPDTHPNLPEFYKLLEDWDSNPTGIFMVMELIDGGCLRNLVPSTGLSEPICKAIFTQIFSGLAFMHSQGMMQLYILM